jgi:hypothetical protein
LAILATATVALVALEHPMPKLTLVRRTTPKRMRLPYVHRGLLVYVTSLGLVSCCAAACHWASLLRLPILSVQAQHSNNAAIAMAVVLAERYMVGTMLPELGAALTLICAPGT